MYAVVVCPHCKNVFIIEKGPKTVSCRKCNKRLDSAGLKPFMETDDFKEAQDARASVVAGMMGEAAPGMDREAIDRIMDEQEARRYASDKRLVDDKMKEEAAKTRKKGQQAILKEAFEELSEKGEVDIEEYWKKVSFHGIDRLKFDAWVEKMIQTGIAFSPRYGYLKKS